MYISDIMAFMMVTGPVPRLTFYFEDAGPEYLKVSPNDVSRIKRRAGEPYWWWLRSVPSGYYIYFNGVTDDGSDWEGINADSVYGVAVGFCL